MGAVYLAEDEVLGRKVAIKVLGSGLLGDEAARVRFRREARVMANVEHPNVVRLYSFSQSEDRDYLVMELVEGRTLGDLIRQRGPIPWREAVEQILQASEGLEAAWEHRIVHRDIKPSNLLVDSRGRVRVSDFGLSRSISGSLAEGPGATSTGQIVGTPLYMSPEQIRGESLDLRSDIYSLGLVFFALLTSKDPYEGDSAMAVILKQLNEPLPDIRQLQSDLPQDLIELVKWMCEKDRDKRPSSYSDLIGRLRELVQLPPEAAARVAEVSRPPRLRPLREALGRKVGGGAAAAVIAIVAVLAIAGLLLLYQGRSEGEHGVEGVESGAQPQKMILAVLPFWGPDEVSTRDGRVLASLVERELEQRFDPSTTTILGIDATKVPVRSHETAREVGQSLGAVAVLWGEVLTVAGESEISPRVTLVARTELAEGALRPDPRMEAHLSRNSGEGGIGSRLQEYEPKPIALSSEGQSQIDLRKDSARKIGDLGSLLAALHLLNQEGDRQAALDLLSELPPTIDVLRLKAEALLQSGDLEGSLEVVREALEVDDRDGAVLALAGDIELRRGDLTAAYGYYSASSEVGSESWTLEGAAFRGFLYRPETFRTSRWQADGTPGEARELRNLYVLAQDPSSGIVRDRVRLSGWAVAFRPTPEGLRVQTEMNVAGLGYRVDEVVIERSGRPNHEIPLPAPNLIARLPRFRSTENLAWNYLPASETRCDGELQLKPENRRRPWALTELEPLLEELSKEWDRDPTCPWTAFLASVVARKIGQEERARNFRGFLLDSLFDQAPYYEWAQMADRAECWGDAEFADELLDRAVDARKRRKQPVWASTLIERYFNAPVNSVRADRGNPNIPPTRRYERIRRESDLMGARLDSGGLEYEAWRQYFFSTGETTLEKDAETRLSTGVIRPANYVESALRFDYWLLVVLSLTGAGLLTLGAFSLAPKREVSNVASGERSSGESLDSRTGPEARVLLCGALLLVAVSAVALPRLGLLNERARLGILVAAVVPLAWRVGRANPLVSSGDRTGRKRLVATSLAVGVTCSVLSALALDSAALQAERIGMLTIGIADAIDHPTFIDIIDREQDGGVRYEGLRFVRALGLHLAGRRDEAREAYEDLRDDQRAKINLEALEAGDPPKVYFDGDDLLPAKRSLREVAADLWHLPYRADAIVGNRFPAEAEGEKTPQVYVGVAFGLLVPILALVALIGAQLPDGGASGFELDGHGQSGWSGMATLVIGVVPGSADVALGRPVRALAIAAGCGLAAAVAGAYLLVGHLNNGILIFPATSTSFFGFFDRPLPPSLWDPEAATSFVFWNLPGQIEVVIGSSVIFLLVLAGHLLGIRDWFARRPAV